ncbi:MAG: ABC transporter substrate-binding protein [Pyrinomonadaceae bacterium]
MKVVSLEPNTIHDIFANIRLVGQLTGREEQAEKVVGNLESRLDGVVLALSDVEQLPRVLMLEWLEPLFAPGHWVPEQVALAGGDHTFGRAGKPSVTTTAEEIQAYAPEIIVLIPCGYYKEDTLRALERTELPVGWSDLPAVVNNQVWAVDATSYFSRPGPRVVEGVEILARILHPEVYGAPSERDAVRVPSSNKQ